MTNNLGADPEGGLATFEETVLMKLKNTTKTGEWMGFGMIIGFIELLKLKTTSNCNALASSCTQLLTTAHVSLLSSL
jgi:hypothetical protein